MERTRFGGVAEKIHEGRSDQRARFLNEPTHKDEGPKHSKHRKYINIMTKIKRKWEWARGATIGQGRSSGRGKKIRVEGEGKAPEAADNERHDTRSNDKQVADDLHERKGKGRQRQISRNDEERGVRQSPSRPDCSSPCSSWSRPSCTTWTSSLGEHKRNVEPASGESMSWVPIRLPPLEESASTQHTGISCK